MIFRDSRKKSSKQECITIKSDFGEDNEILMEMENTPIVM
jgi:hypothetical protein